MTNIPCHPGLFMCGQWEDPTMSHVSTRKAQSREVRGTQHGHGRCRPVGWAVLSWSWLPPQWGQIKGQQLEDGEPWGSDIQIPQPLIFLKCLVLVYFDYSDTGHHSILLHIMPSDILQLLYPYWSALFRALWLLLHAHDQFTCWHVVLEKASAGTSNSRLCWSLDITHSNPGRTRWFIIAKGTLHMNHLPWKNIF